MKWAEELEVKDYLNIFFSPTFPDFLKKNYPIMIAKNIPSYYLIWNFHIFKNLIIKRMNSID